MDNKKKLERLVAKRDKLLNEYKSHNRHDFSGSWKDRIENNTGGSTVEEWRKNCDKKIKVMNKYNIKTQVKLEEMRMEIEDMIRLIDNN